MKNTIEFLITRPDIGLRLDVYLTKKLKNFTRSYIKKLIQKKK